MKLLFTFLFLLTTGTYAMYPQAGRNYFTLQPALDELQYQKNLDAEKEDQRELQRASQYKTSNEAYILPENCSGIMLDKTIELVNDIKQVHAKKRSVYIMLNDRCSLIATPPRIFKYHTKRKQYASGEEFILITID
jgi:hypothetical protein